MEDPRSGVFFALAVLLSGQRSAATPPFVQLCQDKKSIPNPGTVLDLI